ncbi:MAG: DUF493 domain-containing protein [Sphingobacteriia bacterium]|nr:DUF493 domain-containing protein [Sphingobacteriia bacterium]NCC38119.1 DUF493 domain-containing protein [Gammaproteobacteria bacterium]
MSKTAFSPAAEGDVDVDSPLVFPCQFSIKAMGLAGPDFERLVSEIVGRHLDAHAALEVRSRPSRGGKWVSVTLTIEARSREQLDAIYRELTAHERIVWVI